MLKPIRLVIIILTVLAIAFIGLYPSLLHFAIERELTHLQDAGFKIQTTGLSTSLTGVRANAVETWISTTTYKSRGRSLPIQLHLDNLSAAPKVQLMPPGIQANLAASIYGGTLQIKATDIIYTPLLNSAISNLDLSLHPQLRAMGVESGRLSGIMESRNPARFPFADSMLKLELQELELHPPSFIQKLIGISRLTSGSATSKMIMKENGVITVESFGFDSSLASGRLSGSARLSSTHELRDLKATADVNLNRADSDKIARWLPILTNQAVDASAKSIRCTIASSSCSNQKSLHSPFGCVQVSCT